MLQDMNDSIRAISGFWLLDCLKSTTVQQYMHENTD